MEYEERDPFLDIRQAFADGQPQVTPEGNVFFYDPYDSRRVRKGDIDWAFEHADVIVQGAYRPAAIEQAPTETQVALVHPQPDGRIVVYSCTQAMYFSMGVLAQHLNLPPNRFKFVGGTVGGGFGGKVDTATEPLAAVLALKTQPPGQVALHARGGVPGRLDARLVARRDGRRGDRGRLAARPQGADAARRGRLHPLLELRRDEALVPPRRRLHRARTWHTDAYVSGRTTSRPRPCAASA